ncbi:transcription coactivator activity protein [Homalodisca vitripennis]|nr:transcription coactivator activity protein [Homalodisca vitripennis]
MLDENSQLIQTIQEYQSKGKVQECMQYQQVLHRNLVYLASIADANQNIQALLPPPQGMPGSHPQHNMMPGPGGPGAPTPEAPPSQPPSGPGNFPPQPSYRPQAMPPQISFGCAIVVCCLRTVRSRSLFNMSNSAGDVSACRSK